MLKSIGLYFRKIDFLNFAVGAIMPIIVLFIVYSSVKSNIILQDTDFLSLLMNHKGKFIFYFFVSFIEEVIFRGIIFGLLLQKCKNKYLSCVIAALIFTLPHIFNTDNISVLVMFIFPFLYGIFANEMFYTTKSIWMPTGFHWLWNYTITSLFLVTGTQSFIYVHIIAAMIIMIPFELYEVDTTNVFPGIYLLIIIFSIAFFYVVIETIFLWTKDKQKFQKIKSTKFCVKDVKEWLEKYFMGYFITLFINNIVFSFFPTFQEKNGALILICNMLILIFIYRIIQSKKKIKIVTIISIICNIIYYLIMKFNIYPINIKMFIIVIAIMLFRNVSEQYNYKCIKIADLKPRMILSYGSVLKFYNSRIKGLPKQTTEATDSRITEDEVNSIKRWSKSTKGEENIVIVRHMPFAPFMLIGEVIFFILHLYI